jgi:hypothetical protein
MRIFINFFLLAFALDALISTIDDVAQLLYDRFLMEQLRSSLALAVLFLSLIVYFLPGIDSRLPKRLLLPLALLAIWAAFGALPFSIYSDYAALSPMLSSFQLLLAASAFAFVKTTTGHWLLPREFFARPVFKLRNTLLFAAGNIVLLPLAIVLLLLATVYAYANHKTAGFVQLGVDGIHLREQSYRREEKTVRLIAMAHIGSAEYYREIGELLSDGNTVVLLEGISDTAELMRSPLSYSRVADFIGLESQENMEVRGRFLDYEDLEAGAAEATTESAFVRADIDSREFSRETLDYIETVATLLNGDSSFVDAYREYTAWYAEHMTPEKEAAIFSEIIDKRNDTLLRYLDQALLSYETIVVPWGAMHMPGLEAAILQRGFVPVESKTRTAIDFSSLF